MNKLRCGIGLFRKFVKLINQLFSMSETKKNGGARVGAGRKPKADEIKLIETMDAIAVPDTVWKMLYAKVLDSDVNAIKTWLQYRYGMPKQIIEQTNLTPITEIVLIDATPDTNT